MWSHGRRLHLSPLPSPCSAPRLPCQFVIMPSALLPRSLYTCSVLCLPDALSLGINVAPSSLLRFLLQCHLLRERSPLNPFALPTLLPGLSSRCCPSRTGHAPFASRLSYPDGLQADRRKEQTVPPVHGWVPSSQGGA